MARHQDETVETASSVDRLTADWFAVSSARLGLSRQTWYHPAVTEILTGVLAGESVDGPLTRLAAARGAAGLDLSETLTDIEVLVDLLPTRAAEPLDHLATARCLDGWAEAFIGGIVAPSCVDSLTGLTTVDYLRVRMDEVYRHCAALDVRPSIAYALVEVHPTASEGSPFVRLTHRIRIARALRARFTGGETIAMSDSGTAVVLTSAGPELEHRAGAVLDQLGTTRSIPARPDITIVPLDDDPATMVEHLDDLGRLSLRGRR